jgi:small-conductance mechanosensitive channel
VTVKAGRLGDVTKIGIRSTKIVTRDNRLLIIPSSAVADSAGVNYSLPDATIRRVSTDKYLSNTGDGCISVTVNPE